MLRRFVALPGLVSITLNGGMSRGYANHLSEIDLTFYLYLTPDAFQAWQRGKMPVTMGITMLDGQLHDIKYLDFLDEQLATGSFRSKRSELELALTGIVRDHHCFMLGQHLAQINFLDDQIAQYDTQIGPHVAQACPQDPPSMPT